MNEIQNIRTMICIIVMLISGCTIMWQIGTRTRTTAILKPLFLSSVVAFFISNFVVGELTKHLIVNLSLMMPFFYMIIELLCVHGSDAAYESDSPRRRMFYQFIYFLGVAAGLIPYFCKEYLPLDVIMGVSVFLQLYCLSLQMRRWIDFVEEPEKK